MINGIRLKVCGITSLVDADAADAVGADYLGFIFHPKSPRGISPAQFKAMSERLPPRKKVAVCVEPAGPDLARLAGLGFDYFQVHFRTSEPLHQVALWSETVGPARLWLVPRLPPVEDVNPAWLPLAETLLLDTYNEEKFGGTGETGDWAKFKRHAGSWPDKHWILSGGLSPANVAAAVTATGARMIDVNSGVEQSPGIKSPAKLQALVLALHNATKRNNPAYG